MSFLTSHKKTQLAVMPSNETPKTELALTTDKPVHAAQITQEQINRNRIDWYKNAGKEEIQLYVSRAKNDVLYGRTVENSSPAEIDAINTCYAAFTSIERMVPSGPKLSDVQALTLFKALTETLRGASLLFAEQAILYPSFSEAWLSQDGKSLRQTLSLVLKTFSSTVMSFSGPTLYPKKEWVSYLPSDHTSTASTHELLASEASLPSAVTAKLEENSRLWEQAQALQNHTPEDSSFLQNSQSTYIPEAVKAYNAFSNSPEPDLATAEVILMQQLNLISNRTRAIINRHTERNLESMRQQLHFLETKTIPTATRLALAQPVQ